MIRTSCTPTVQKLSGLRPARSYENIGSLNKAADFIRSEFQRYGYSPLEQKYKVDGIEYRNIIASLWPGNRTKVYRRRPL